MTTSRKLASATLGVALIVVPPAVWSLLDARAVGDTPGNVTAMGFAGDDRPNAELGTTDDSPGSAVPPPTTTSVSGAIDPARWPRSIRIDAIGVDAPVDPVGLETDGSMQVPTRGERVGWYQRGSVPGQPGTAALTAHVDTRRGGQGAFIRLNELRPGDTVEIVDASDTRTQWRVTGRERRAKEDLPADTLFARNGPPRLVLITCGGAFDASARSYADNVLVYAEPLETVTPG